MRSLPTTAEDARGLRSYDLLAAIQIEFPHPAGPWWYSSAWTPPDVSSTRLRRRVADWGEITATLGEGGPGGVSFLQATFQLRVHDPDGELRDRWEDVNFQRSRCEIRWALWTPGQAQPRTDDAVMILRGVVVPAVNWREGDLTVTLAVSDYSVRENVNVGLRAQRADWPYIATADEGRVIPLIYGYPNAVPAVPLNGGPRAHLVQDISRTDTTIYVDNGYDFPQATAITICIGDENIEGSFAGNTFTVTGRGAILYSGTTTAVTPANQVCTIVDNAIPATYADNAFVGYQLEMDLDPVPGVSFLAHRTFEMTAMNLLPRLAAHTAHSREIIRYDAANDIIEFAHPFTLEMDIGESVAGKLHIDGFEVRINSGIDYNIRTFPAGHETGALVTLVDEPARYAVCRGSGGVRNVYVHGRKKNPKRLIVVHRTFGVNYSGSVEQLARETLNNAEAQTTQPETQWIPLAPEMWSVTTEDDGHGGTITVVDLVRKPTVIGGYICDRDDVLVDATGPADGQANLIVNPASVIRHVATEYGDIGDEAWSERDRNPRARYYHSTCGYNDRVYVFGGFDNTNTLLNDFWAYDPRADAWTMLASGGAAPPARAYAAICGYDGKIYVHGGRDGVADRQDLWEYNIEWNSWRRLGDSLLIRRLHDMCELNGRLYIFGGNAGPGGVLGADLVEYDPQTDAWSNVTTGPMIARRGHVLRSYDGKIYLTGGVNAPTLYGDDMWEYDPAIGWTEKTSPPSEFYLGDGDMVGRNLYIFGGQEQGSPYNNDLWKYDTYLDAWSQLIPGATARHAHGFAAARDRLYTFAGNDAGAGYLNDMWEYDPEKDFDVGAAAAELAKWRMNFALLDERMLLDIVADLVFQARCALRWTRHAPELVYQGASGGLADLDLSRARVMLDSLMWDREDLDSVYSVVTTEWIEKHGEEAKRQRFTLESTESSDAFGRREFAALCWAYNSGACPTALAYYLLERFRHAHRISQLDATVYGTALQPGDLVAIDLPAYPYPPEKGQVLEARHRMGRHPDGADLVRLRVRNFHWPGCIGSCEGFCETTACEHSCQTGWEPGSCWTCETACQTLAQLGCASAAQAVCGEDTCQAAATAGCHSICMPTAMLTVWGCGHCESLCMTGCETSCEGAEPG